MNKLSSTILVTGLVLAFLVSAAPAQAANWASGRCPVSGECTINSSGSFNDTIDGIDGDASQLIVGSAVTLTVNDGQEINRGSGLVVNGAIAIADGATIYEGRAIYMLDSDGDGWPAATTKYWDSAAGRVLRSNLVTYTADCNDANGSLNSSCYSQSSYYGQSSYAYNQSAYYNQSSYAYSQSAYYGQSAYYSQSAYCFLPDTGVLMADGSTKAIEDVQVSELVMSFDLTTGQQIPNKVEKISVHDDAEGYLTINDTLKVTGNHPIWANDQYWVKARDLVEGDTMTDNQGNQVVVESIDSTGGTNTVYNLLLENEPHNYFAEGVLVHNGEEDSDGELAAIVCPKC